MFNKAVILVLALAPTAFGQYMGLTDTSGQGYDDRLDWPKAWFYTPNDCGKLESSDLYSIEFQIHPKNNGECFKMDTRTALWINHDPQKKKEKIHACVYLYEKDDCTDNSDGKHKSDVETITLKWDDDERDEDICFAFATQKDENKYLAYMIEVVDTDKDPELYCEQGYNNLGHISRITM